MTETFLQALSTLLHSWGSDTPPEAIWAANEFVDFFAEVRGKENHNIEFKEDLNDDDLDIIFNKLKTW